MDFIDRKELQKKIIYRSLFIESLKTQLHDLFIKVLPNCAEHKFLGQKISSMRREFLNLLKEISGAAYRDEIEVINKESYH